MNLPAPKHGYFEGSVDSEPLKRKVEFLIESLKKTDIVGFIGGPPCPDFSVAGKQKGKDGENGKLSKVYIDLILKNKPHFFLFENVKGLWKTAKHREFYDEMKSSLREAGYFLTDRLTNSIEFGVAQDRDRIILFGITNSLLPQKYNENLLNNEFGWMSHAKYSTDRVLDKKLWPSKSAFEENSVLTNNWSSVIDELTVEYWFKLNNVDNHTNAKHHFNPKPTTTKFQSTAEGEVSKKSFKRLHRYRYSPTAAYGNNEVHLHPYKARRLSAAEALAIQSLPIEFELPDTMTLSDMFKTIGNGVPYLLSKAVAITILEYIVRKNLLIQEIMPYSTKVTL